MAYVEHFGVDGCLQVHAVFGRLFYLCYGFAFPVCLLPSYARFSAKILVVFLLESGHLNGHVAFVVIAFAENTECSQSGVSKNAFALHLVSVDGLCFVFFVLDKILVFFREESAVFCTFFEDGQLQQSVVLSIRNLTVVQTEIAVLIFETFSQTLFETFGAFIGENVAKSFAHLDEVLVPKLLSLSTHLLGISLVVFVHILEVNPEPVVRQTADDEFAILVKDSSSFGHYGYAVLDISLLDFVPYFPLLEHSDRCTAYDDNGKCQEAQYHYQVKAEYYVGTEFEHLLFLY